jgi:hypothetical protein
MGVLAHEDRIRLRRHRLRRADGPHAWRDAPLALLPDHDPCPGFRPDAWSRAWSNALDFIERHGAEAHRLGWTAEELFGVHPALGVIRVDRTGALMLSSAGGCSQSRPI